MAIISAGYAGTVNDRQWAKMGRYHGARYSVLDRGSLNAYQVGGTRTLRIDGGEFYGDGILDVSDATIDITPTVPANGQWFLVVARRTWATGLTTLVAIPHITTTTSEPATIPTSFPQGGAGRHDAPGTVADQPLYWLWINSATITMVVVDIRDLPPGTPKRGTVAQRDAYYGSINIQSTAGRRYLQDVRAAWLELSTGERMVWLEGYSEASNPSGARGGPGWFYDAAAPCRWSRKLRRASVPSGTASTFYFLADDGAMPDRATAVVPTVTYDGATGIFAVTTPGEWRFIVTGWVDNANVSDGRYVILNPDGGGTAGDAGNVNNLAGIILTSGQMASAAWVAVATPSAPARFKIEGFHTSGATRNLRARVDIERIRP